MGVSALRILSYTSLLIFSVILTNNGLVEYHEALNVMLHGRCCSIAQLPYLFQVTIRANPSNDLLVHYRLVLMMDRSAKLSLWLETFDMALFILSFFKGSA